MKSWDFIPSRIPVTGNVVDEAAANKLGDDCGISWVDVDVAHKEVRGVFEAVESSDGGGEHALVLVVGVCAATRFWEAV